jgi:glycosyltransferase involved in cell wall biosynthesis
MAHPTSDPTVSVVIASGAGGEFLPRCLESLRQQAAEQNAEILVVDRCGGEVRARLQSEFDFIQVLEADPAERPSVPQLRKMGALAAKAPIVAVIEEHCVAPPQWLATIRESLQPEDAAIGGPILDDNYPRIRDWVVYFSEYNNYLPPWPEEDRYVLNGANIAYNRELLLQQEDVLDKGYWEVVLHPPLSESGRFRSVPRMGIPHTGPFNYGYYLEQRYLLSRVWGGTQRNKVSAVKRLIYLLAAPVFPFLLLARIALRVFKSGQRIGRFLLAIPLLVPTVFTYVWGEWRGYLSGPGDALERVE